MIDRIQKIIQFKKLTSSAFADKIGVPRSTISHIISGRNNPSLEFIQKVLDNFPEINTEWLVRGQGHMFRASKTLFPDDDFLSEENVSIGQVEFDRPLDTNQKTEAISASSSISLPKGNFSDQMPADKILYDADEGKDAGILNEKSASTLIKKDKEEVSLDKKSKFTVRVLLFYNDGSFSEHFQS